jgi:hypothetical protein
MMFFYDYGYLLFVLPALILGIIASILMRVWTNKYLQIENLKRITGVELVERVASRKGFDIRLNITADHLADNFAPNTGILTLSREVAQTSSIASVAIAAHELGHVDQHYSRSPLMMVRNFLVPAINIGTQLGYFLLMLGLILSFTPLAWVGVILFSSATLFSLVTLPIELDASRRAMNMLEEEQILFRDEMSGARKVLSAAALTYVAATLQSLLSLLYFIFRVQALGKRS